MNSRSHGSGVILECEEKSDVEWVELWPQVLLDSDADRRASDPETVVNRQTVRLVDEEIQARSSVVFMPEAHDKIGRPVAPLDRRYPVK